VGGTACFRAGYTAGKQTTERRFVLRSGRMRITVWATGIMEAPPGKKSVVCEEKTKRLGVGG